jgi:hypothetical protein
MVIEIWALDSFISKLEALMSFTTEAFIMIEALDKIMAIMSKVEIITCFFFMIFIKNQTLYNLRRF